MPGSVGGGGWGASPRGSWRWLALLAACFSCDSDPDAFPPEEVCPQFDYSSFTADTPEVSFSQDVLPILAANCTDTGCHGSALTPASGLFLSPTEQAEPKPGEPSFPADEETRRLIVDTYLVAAARTTPDKPRVSPGEPDASLLMHKLDGSHNCGDLSCPGNNCGQQMPRGKAPLSAEQRDVLRRWIAQGAIAD